MKFRNYSQFSLADVRKGLSLSCSEPEEVERFFTLADHREGKMADAEMAYHYLYEVKEGRISGNYLLIYRYFISVHPRSQEVYCTCWGNDESPNEVLCPHVASVLFCQSFELMPFEEVVDGLHRAAEIKARLVELKRRYNDPGWRKFHYGEQPSVSTM